MNDVLAAAVEIQAFARSQQWKLSVIWGVALVRWGQPRTTADVDVNLLTGFGQEEPFIDSLLSEFDSRVSQPKEFAMQSRVLLLQASNDIGIDVALGGLPFEENLAGRASEYDYGEGVRLLTASAEDMVVLKAFASRPQDWIDVEGIIIRQADTLDWQVILEELTPLCELKEAPEIIERLTQLRDHLAE